MNVSSHLSTPRGANFDEILGGHITDTNSKRDERPRAAKGSGSVWTIRYNAMVSIFAESSAPTGLRKIESLAMSY